MGAAMVAGEGVGVVVGLGGGEGAGVGEGESVGVGTTDGVGEGMGGGVAGAGAGVAASGGGFDAAGARPSAVSLEADVRGAAATGDFGAGGVAAPDTSVAGRWTAVGVAVCRTGDAGEDTEAQPETETGIHNPTETGPYFFETTAPVFVPSSLHTAMG